MQFSPLHLILAALLLFAAAPGSSAPTHHLEARQRPTVGTCDGYNVPNKTAEYYIVCQVDPETRVAKGNWTVGNGTDLVLEVGCLDVHAGP
jgi:hypothetical protein